MSREVASSCRVALVAVATATATAMQTSDANGEISATVDETNRVRAELGLDKDVDAATRAKLDALKARPSSTQKIF